MNRAKFLASLAGLAGVGVFAKLPIGRESINDPDQVTAIEVANSFAELAEVEIKWEDIGRGWYQATIPAVTLKKDDTFVLSMNNMKGTFTLDGRS